jgi:hypothetical protein
LKAERLRSLSEQLEKQKLFLVILQILLHLFEAYLRKLFKNLFKEASQKICSRKFLKKSVQKSLFKKAQYNFNYRVKILSKA